jgi:hypothetical protein
LRPQLGCCVGLLRGADPLGIGGKAIGAPVTEVTPTVPDLSVARARTRTEYLHGARDLRGSDLPSTAYPADHPALNPGVGAVAETRLMFECLVIFLLGLQAATASTPGSHGGDDDGHGNGRSPDFSLAPFSLSARAEDCLPTGQHVIVAAAVAGERRK